MLRGRRLVTIRIINGIAFAALIVGMLKDHFVGVKVKDGEGLPCDDSKLTTLTLFEIGRAHV